LEVGCGTGDWVRAVAQASPSIQISGLDKRDHLLAPAQHRADAEGSTNALFSVQDVRTLDPHRFPEQSFDLISMAFLAPAMLTLDYQALVCMLLPLGRPDGMVRWTEMEFPVTSSPVLARLTNLTCRALQQTGHSFVPPVFQELDALFAQWNQERRLPARPIERRHLGITPMMGSWLRKAGYRHIRHFPTAIEVSYGTDAHGCFVHTVECFAQQIKPFLLAQGVIATDNYEPLVAQVHDDLHQESFCGLCMLLTVCARIPQ
jgi:ubiquinone/menaquinone biosynthesis C-methylase UbiE